MALRALPVIVLLASACLAQAQNSRSVSRSGPTGNVNLVEFNIRGTTYGRCSFFQSGEEVELMYEDSNGDLTAKATNPTILDPVSKAHECREAATRAPETPARFRSDMGEVGYDETPQQLALRIADFRQKLSTNQKYISDLQPRFLGFNNNGDGGYLVTFGNQETTTSNKPEFGIGLPHKDYNQATMSLGFPFSGGNLFNNFGRRR